MIKYLKKHPILIVLFFALLIKIMVLIQLGVYYNLNSDDVSYINSGITFLDTGQITMHGMISAQIMPGMTFLIAFIAMIFGKTLGLWLVLKLLWITMGLLSIYGVYKIVEFKTTKRYAIIASLFLLAVDFAWMDNIILTETPFMLTFIFLIYHTFKLEKNKQQRDFYLVIFYYITCLMFRPVIALYPIFLFGYLLIKKYDIKLMIKQAIIAGVILLLILTPWVIRNYKVFNAFIPLTYGSGNPLLLGTYQGINYPKDKELNYKKNVDDKLPTKMKEYLYNKKYNNSYMRGYYSLEYDKYKANYRMRIWWQTDKISMLKSYLIMKPLVMVNSSFYWREVLGVSKNIVMVFRKIDLVLFLIAGIFIFLERSKINEFFFLLSVYSFQIAVYAYTFSFDRYGQTLHFLRFIIIGLGLFSMYEYFQRKRNIENKKITKKTISI